MFDSGISAKELILSLKSEVDIALEIPNAAYVTWLNSLEQMLYGDIIREQGVLELVPESEIIDLATLEIPEDEDKISFEDIHSVYVNRNLQLIKSSAANGCIFPNTYYKKGNKLTLNTKNPITKLRLIYIVKPKPKVTDGDGVIGDGNIMIPLEFAELVKAKLRYEAYMLANENTPAANQLGVYNALLDSFKQWIADREPQFG